MMEHSGFSEQADFSATTLNSFESHDERPLAMLTGTIITPPGGGPFVSFDRAILRIKCLLIPVKFDKVMDKNRLRYLASLRPIDLWHSYGVKFLSASLGFLQLGDRDRALNQSRFELRLSRSFDPSSRCYFIPFYLNKSPAHPLSDLSFHGALAYGLLIQETVENNNREFTRIGILEECWNFTSQLSPMISNTIVKKGIGMASASTDGLITPEEEDFESKLGNFAATQVSRPVKIRVRGLDRETGNKPSEEMNNGASNKSGDESDDEGSDGRRDGGSHVSSGEIGDGKSDETRDWNGNRMVECSRLPHFATAEWTTISLV
ncbi:hypothetical protein ACJZ2D_007133 [Fusarium nematophilum]